MSEVPQKVKAVIAYNGASFQGFQRQKSTPRTITHEIEAALRSLHITAPIVGSGRTDAGVHATGQVIHFEVPHFWKDLQKLKVTLNRKLKNIRFKHITRVDPQFHARFSAKKRLYRYLFKPTLPSLFEEHAVACYSDFNTQILQEALHCFEGEHDFIYFQKSGSDPHSTIRKIYHAQYRCWHGYHLIYFQANGFLRAQVRMMIDAAMQCAKGKLTISELQEQIAGEKRHTFSLAPSEGLYLARVLY